MKTLLKNGKVINVFTGEIETGNVLIENDRIIGVGDYDEADVIEDVSGKYICPSFIDGHIHIESTMLLPRQLANVCISHGTCAIIADPHEIANVAGASGLNFMMEASEGLPMNIYFMLPSCVPATPFDESGAVLGAKDLAPFYWHKKVLGLAEMMNYPGVVAEDPSVMEKLSQANSLDKLINGHAPLLSGKDLDKYIFNGIKDDHECTSIEEAKEKIRKGQTVMIREGTSAKNLESLIDLFDEPFAGNCILVTDDKHPYDLLTNGHIDAIIRKAVRLGKNPVTGIQMATIQAARHFGLRGMGAVAPGYFANIVVLNDLDLVDVSDVYFYGEKVCDNKVAKRIERFDVDPSLARPVYRSFFINHLLPENFHIKPEGKKCRAIRVIPGEILTKEEIIEPDFGKDNGVDAENGIIKLAVCERYKHTGHIGLGFIKDLGIKKGAIASSVSHDSHNLIIAGTNDEDMALAGNTVVQMCGGLCVVENGCVKARLPLPIAGLISTESAEEVARQNFELRKAVSELGASENVEPFMNLAFISLTVIPDIKMSTKGLIDVNKFSPVSLFVD